MRRRKARKKESKSTNLVESETVSRRRAAHGSPITMGVEAK